MISLRELAKYSNIDDEVKIICTDGEVLIGKPDSVDDEEESGIDEPGITLCLPSSAPVVIGVSEIEAISIFKKNKPASLYSNRDTEEALPANA